MTNLNIKHPDLLQGYLDYDRFLGLEFVHGVQDCYELVRQIFSHNLGIELTPYARPDDWWVHDMDLYMQNFRKEGFDTIETDDLKAIRPLDCFLIAIPDPRKPNKMVTNHCGVYVGDGLMIHHRLGKLSQTLPYRGVYRNFTTAIVRHKDAPDLSAKKIQTADLMDYILPHKKQALLGALNERKP